MERQDLINMINQSIPPNVDISFAKICFKGGAQIAAMSISTAGQFAPPGCEINATLQSGVTTLEMLSVPVDVPNDGGDPPIQVPGNVGAPIQIE